MRIRIFVQADLMAEFTCSPQFMIGRQDLDKDEPGPYQLLAGKADALPKLIIAPYHQRNISRREIQVNKTAANTLQLLNLTNTPITVGGQARMEVHSGNRLERTPPVKIHFPTCEIQITLDTQWKQSVDDSLFRQTLLQPPAALAEENQLSMVNRKEWRDGMKTATWVLNQTLSQPDFFPAVARAIKDFVCLDGGRVLTLDGNQWREECQYPPGGLKLPWSQTALDKVKEMATSFSKSDEGPIGQSQVSGQLSTLIATPFFREGGEVAGVLYGEKSTKADGANIGSIDSYILWMEMLAAAVSTGLRLRVEQKKAKDADTRFAAFTSPMLAKRLTEDPGLLKGRKEEVSVLFADIRGFSRISERIGPEKAIDWVNSVMNELSSIVDAQGGITTGYLGDGLMALWGAPTPQRDHAARALEAALAMLERLPAMNETWQAIIGEECKIGIGLNSGEAMVGNVGSDLKVQYGALGNAVNLASRIEGLTKYLQCPLLVTRATQRSLDHGFMFRRICLARVANIVEPVEVFEAARMGNERTSVLFAETEAALASLEKGDFTAAARQAGTSLASFKGDGPLLLTLARSAKCLVERTDAFDPVWVPPGK